MGVIAPNQGSILVDGISLDNSNKRSWQDKIGYVPQTIFLTDDSIKKNIALGVKADDIDESKVRSALKSSYLDEFIAQLPDGINTNVGEKGVKLSGGQKQRIGIARAMYNNPKVLILDEFTSSLDIETEKKVMKSINDIKGKMTVIIISHRPSIIQQCHKIFKISNGKLEQESSK